MFSVVLLLFGITNAVIKISDDEIYELTPFGYWLSDCIHRVPSASHIVNYNDHFTINNRKISRCKTLHNSSLINERMFEHTGKDLKATGNGWQAYVKQDMGSAVTGFSGNWIVPALPIKKSTEEVLYSFIAVQNIDWVPPENNPQQPFDIIQPVLQYGYESGKGGGPFWGISSWYVTLSNDVVQSPLIRVNPGEVIYGVMQKVGSDSWFINSIDTTSGQNTSFVVSRAILSSQPWVYVTLEVYNIDNCQQQYPPKGTSIPFSNLVLQNNHQNETIEWTVGRSG
eukprot:971315_1